MKRKLIFFCVGISLALILQQFGLWNALLLFLLVGAVPGTEFSLSPLVMVIALTGVSAFLLYRFRRHADKDTAHRLPKKRYTQV